MGWRLHRSFAHFGTKGRNQRWSWSAISEDRKAVAITLWQDGLTQEGPFVRFGTGLDRADADWVKRAGNRERQEYLEHAVAELDGIFHPVVTVPRDRDAEPRSIKLAWPVDKLMRIQPGTLNHFGGFVALSVEPASVEEFSRETWPPLIVT